MNLEDAENILAWAKSRGLDIVFNMLRFTENMLNNKGLEEQIQFRQREEEFMRKFFLDRVSEESVLSGQSFMYLHYADMIANGYHRTMPCPFQSQGLLLNPEGNLFYCENSEKLGNVLDDTAEALYFKAGQPRAPRGDQGEDLPHLPQPVPGQRRRHEAGRALREVPAPRLPRQARPVAASRNHFRPYGEVGNDRSPCRSRGPASCGWRFAAALVGTFLRAPIRGPSVRRSRRVTRRTAAHRRRRWCCSIAR